MAKYFFKKDDQYLLNRCTKFLSRYNTDARHSYGAPGEQSPRDRIAEAWRFPIIDTYGGGADAVTDPGQFDDYNEVTFIYPGADSKSPASVSVIGTFATLCEPVPLEQVGFEGLPGDSVKHLDKKLWELRISGRDGNSRAIYVTASGRRMVILRVFSKKTQKTPRHELELARQRAKEVK